MTTRKAAIAAVAGLAGLAFAGAAAAEVVDFNGEQFDTDQAIVLEGQAACTADQNTVAINVAFFPSKTDIDASGRTAADIQAEVTSTFASAFSTAVSGLSTEDFAAEAGYAATVTSMLQTIETMEGKGITLVAAQPSFAFARPGCN